MWTLDKTGEAVIGVEREMEMIESVVRARFQARALELSRNTAWTTGFLVRSSVSDPTLQSTVSPLLPTHTLLLLLNRRESMPSRLSTRRILFKRKRSSTQW